MKITEREIVLKKGTVFKGRKMLIVGMARSGVAAAALANEIGAIVTITDTKKREELGEALSPLDGTGVCEALGEDGTARVKDSDIVMISPGVPLNAPVVREADRLGIPVTGELEFASLLCPCEYAAVTGTNGKTTTVTLLSEMFGAEGKGRHACGNIGYPFSQSLTECRKEDKLVAEVSSFQLETTVRFHPRAAAVLNVTEDHLNRHGTMEVYTGLKRHIFDAMDENDTAVLNMEDPLTRVMTDIRPRVLMFSSLNETEEGLFLKNGIVTARIDGRETGIIPAEDIYIPGRHNLENAMAASALALSMGISRENVAKTLRTFNGVEHRIEFVREKDGVRYINDSKGTNCDSTEKAVLAMDRPTILILGGYDKHVSFDGLSRLIKASPMIRKCVIIGDTAEKIEQSLKAVGYTETVRAGDMEEAVRISESLCREGWNVLLSPACASFDMFKDFEERGRVFKEIVNKL
ncbi:MAG: UDP-N-acetylmuramoyl-L-alanine--D-glutamate ligase [Clostridia bacterium]|nr:UDP-N-acetylmuramoyl-L-alanine--D-glutamate ligase [Clostridia bacterium]